MAKALLIEEDGDHDDVSIIDTEEESRLTRFFTFLIDWSLIVLMFVMPFVVLPNLPDASELPKQLVLLFGVGFIGICWSIRLFLTREVSLRRSFLLVPIGLYVVGVILASVFSQHRTVSLFGGSANEYASLATLVGLVLYLFFVITSRADFTIVRRLLLAILMATGVVSFLGSLHLLGISIPLLPATYITKLFGSVYAEALVATIALLIGCGLFLFNQKDHDSFLNGSGLWIRLVVIITSVLNLVYLVVLDWWVAWVILLGGSVMLLIFLFTYANAFRNTGRVILVLIVCACALLFLLIRAPLPNKAPIELGISSRTSLDIAVALLRDRPVFGSGPGTFAIAYARYRPMSFNASQLWNVRFDRASSAFLTHVATTGLVGLLLWLIVVGCVVGLIIRTFLREPDPTTWLLGVVLGVPWIALVAGQFLYPSNMVLAFMWWALTALLVIITTREMEDRPFAASPRALIGSAASTIVVGILMVVMLVLDVNRAYAWAAFGRASVSANAGNVSKAREEIVRATEFDPDNDVFFRNLAEVRLNEASNAKDKSSLQRELQGAVESATKATQLGSASVLNWEMLGGVLREMTPVVTGAGEQAINAFTRARQLDPQNPTYPTEIAKVSLLISDSLRAATQSRDVAVRDDAVNKTTVALNRAREALKDALALKQDYSPAHYYTALVLEREGKLNDAIVKMKSVVQYNSNDVGARFGLGVLLLEIHSFDEAQQQFEAVIKLSPNYANAHWYLASVYEAKGRIADAINEVKMVAKLNPTNTQVKERLAALLKGTSGNNVPSPVSDNGMTVLTP